MNNWRTRYEVVEKEFQGFSKMSTYTRFVIRDKHNPDRRVNGTFYYYKSEAASAASNIFRAEQRAFEKALLG